MATTYAKTITNTTITATTLNTGVAATMNFSTSTRSLASSTDVGVDGTNAECWTFTPTKAGSKIVVLFNASSTKAVQGTFKIPAGDLWAGDDITGVFGSTLPCTGSSGIHVTAATFDSAKCLQDDGTIDIIVSADTTDSLYLGHYLNIVCLETL
jgi:hypothetical protein